MKYAQFDDNGFVKGFYDDGIHKTIPEDAIPITDKQYETLLDNKTTKRWSGSKVVSGEKPARDFLPEEVRNMQGSLIRSVAWIAERHLTQRELGIAEEDRDSTIEQYQAVLQYMQDVRVLGNNENANDAMADLLALTPPA